MRQNIKFYKNGGTAMPDTQPEKEKQPDTGSVTNHSPRGNIHCITIIGQVEGHMSLPPQNKSQHYFTNADST